jgi:exodeoxyribonuclease VII large subunit
LPRALTANAQLHHQAFARIAGRLAPQVLNARMARCADALKSFADRARRGEAVVRRLRRERLEVARLRLRANAQTQHARIERCRERAFALAQRAGRAMRMRLRRGDDAVERCSQLLTALSYRGVLARGFAMVREPEGKPLRTAAEVGPGHAIDIEFSDGHVRARSEGVRMRPAEPAPRRRRRFNNPDQGNLFG